MAAAATDARSFARSPLAMQRAATSLLVCVLLWELGSRMRELTGVQLAGIGELPAPSQVLLSWASVVADPGYWMSWLFSFLRVMAGFVAALIIGVPLGLMLATNRLFNGIAFPVFEIIRPIPPLAWVPASIIFWPTQETAIIFITFLGAFFTITINVFGGAQAIDNRFLQATRSLGASRAYVFRRIVLPATVPSIVVASAVAIGITWEVVVAAEMISGSSKLSASGGGLGHFIWSSYLGGAYEQIIVGMISIGIAGYLCSAAVRALGRRLTPWLTQR